MQCKQGDLCFIKKSIRPINVGLIVTCKEYLGYFLKDDVVEINGERWAAIVSDNYWLIESDSSSIETQYGKSRQSYIPDLWLFPIKSDGIKNQDKTNISDELTV